MTNVNQKIYLKNTEKDKKCKCVELIKKYFKKTKIELLSEEFERTEEYIYELKKNIQYLVDENKQLVEEKKQLSEENKKLKYYLNMKSEINNINDDKHLVMNVNDFYDAVINIKSIRDISKGWEIKMSERMMNNYEKFKTEKNIRIGVIGNSNKGKSFLLSKISKSYLPSGSSIRTEGLSFKYPEIEDKRIILLDSAGLETPVLQESKQLEIKIENEEINNKIEKDKHSVDDFKDKSREKLITELFLQNYIINNSDILLIVVGILTYSEQKLINKIKSLQKPNKTKVNKALFIIHNLMTFTLKKQVEEYINEYLLKSITFSLEEGHYISTNINSKKGKYFYEKNIEENRNIFHLIYANEGSEAGDYYNEFTLNFLDNSFQNITDLKPFDVIETIKNRFIDLSQEIIENLDKPITISDFNDDKKTIKLLNINNFTLKKCFIDELGFSNLKSNEFEPKYNYYKKDDKIAIKIEAPGNISKKLNISREESDGYKIIKIRGEKENEEEPEDINENIYSSREFGKFCVQCPIKSEDSYIIKNQDPTFKYENGLIILEYQIEKTIKETEVKLPNSGKI